MTAHFVALSDLHLGYDNSLLNNSGSQYQLAVKIGQLCGGQTDRLILNGDAFEACVPQDAGVSDLFDVSPYMAEKTRDFFTCLLWEVRVESLIIVWGNHDFAMWKKIADSCGISPYTNGTKGDVLLQNEGCDLPGASQFLDVVIGESRKQFTRIRSAYPNYILGRDWPYLAFHHGHFLDNLILGYDNDAAYLGLQALTGVGRPTVNIHDGETVKSLYEKTSDFVAATWALNSKARQLEWAMLRRQEKQRRCDYFPSDLPPASRLVPHTEPFSESIGKNTTWYTNLLMMDATTPSPLGGRNIPSYLFLGHDHNGGFQDIFGMDGLRWNVINTGGWTSDGGSSEVHGHVTLWEKGASAPEVHCVRVA